MTGTFKVMGPVRDSTQKDYLGKVSGSKGVTLTAAEKKIRKKKNRMVKESRKMNR